MCFTSYIRRPPSKDFIIQGNSEILLRMCTWGKHNEWWKSWKTYQKFFIGFTLWLYIKWVLVWFHHKGKSPFRMFAWENLYAGFRLTCRLPHCCFDDDICSTAQAPLAAEGWPSGKQHQANRSITFPLLPTAADRRQLNSIQLGSDAARW